MRSVVSEILFTVGLMACTAPERPPAPSEPASAASLAPAPVLVPSAAPKPPAPVLTPKRGFTTVFEWKYDAEARGWNVEHIAKQLHGTVLDPGARWSFNKVIGARTLERGFKSAPSLLLGEVTKSVGGGSCQVSSTLYAAALLSGMTIVSRRAHSRPSKYIHMGLDAAVSYPKECWDKDKPDLRICLDLVIENPFDYRVHIHTKITEKDNIRKVLSVELLGEHPEPITAIKYRWVTYKVHDFPTRYRRVTRWENDRKKLKQSGSTGHEGALRLSRDGKDEWVHSHYQPVPEVWLVGRDFEIPELNGDEDGSPGSKMAE
jgi:hypothetical protein